jgi:hypothetical protein
VRADFEFADLVVGGGSLVLAGGERESVNGGDDGEGEQGRLDGGRVRSGAEEAMAIPASISAVSFDVWS